MSLIKLDAGTILEVEPADGSPEARITIYRRDSDLLLTAAKRDELIAELTAPKTKGTA